MFQIFNCIYDILASVLATIPKIGRFFSIFWSLCSQVKLLLLEIYFKTGLHSHGRPLGLPGNIRLGRECLAVNTVHN